MAEPLIPEYVDAKKIFAQQAVISGDLPVERFERFCQSLANNTGNVLVSLQFLVDDRYKRVISGELRANVQVYCQRCLEVMPIEIADSFKLGVVDSESFIDRLPPELEPWISADHRLVLADIIEEQLILCMPIVSYHESDCNPAREITMGDNQPGRLSADEENQDKSNPFAILQSLKDKK